MLRQFYGIVLKQHVANLEVEYYLQILNIKIKYIHSEDLIIFHK